MKDGSWWLCGFLLGMTFILGIFWMSSVITSFDEYLEWHNAKMCEELQYEDNQ